MKEPTDKTAMAIVFLIVIFFTVGISSVGYYFFKAMEFGLDVSEKATDWGGFGSFVSGVFAPLSSLGVIAAIYIFEKQYFQQHKIFDEQKKIEEYKIHKNDFLKSLDSIEEKNYNYIKIKAKVDLYHFIFKDSGVVNFKRTISFKDFDKSDGNDIENVFGSYEKLYGYLSNPVIDDEDIPVVLYLFNKINYSLGIELRKRSYIGNVTISGIQPNFNIF